MLVQDFKDYREASDALHTHKTDVPEAIRRALIAKCQENPWLKDGGVYFEDDPFLEADSPFSFVQIDDFEYLELFFDYGNWAIRNGVVYGDLAFINQVNGGDEWLTLKRFGDRWLAFESVTFGPMIARSEFSAYIVRLQAATEKQCKSLDY